jgi:hypothetical protein
LENGRSTCKRQRDTKQKSNLAGIDIELNFDRYHLSSLY